MQAKRSNLDTLFVLIVASTEVIKHKGISAAGVSHEKLALTSAKDAEYIYYGNTDLPVSPSGIVSPALISKACLDLLDYDICIIDAGSIITPNCPHEKLSNSFAGDPSTGQTMSFDFAQVLYQKAFDFANEKFTQYQKIIIAESVVGGTTTALGLLGALGFDCFDMVSSSIPAGNHQLKNQIIKEGLSKMKSSHEDIKKKPILAAASLGDTMQITATAIAQAFNKEIILAGGSQMLAVKALSDASSQKDIVLSPSPWIVEDKSARFLELVDFVSPGTRLEYIKAEDILNNKTLSKKIFELKPEASLESIIDNYNQGHVKEGVGMGALLALCNQLTYSSH